MWSQQAYRRNTWPNSSKRQRTQQENGGTLGRGQLPSAAVSPMEGREQYLDSFQTVTSESELPKLAECTSVERHLLRSMIRQIKLAFDEWIYRRHGDNQAPLVHDPRVDAEDKTLTISCVSPLIAAGIDGATSELVLTDYRDECKLLEPTERHDIDTWEKDRHRELTWVLERNPEIICFPEFAFPPPPKNFRSRSLE